MGTGCFLRYSVSWDTKGWGGFLNLHCFPRSQGSGKVQHCLQIPMDPFHQLCVLLRALLMTAHTCDLFQGITWGAEACGVWGGLPSHSQKCLGVYVPCPSLGPIAGDWMACKYKSPAPIPKAGCDLGVTYAPEFPAGTLEAETSPEIVLLFFPLLSILSHALTGFSRSTFYIFIAIFLMWFIVWEGFFLYFSYVYLYFKIMSGSNYIYSE